MDAEPAVFLLERELIAAYRQAVEDESGPDADVEAVPPMAVAALSIRAALEQLGLPPGTIHAGQEFTFLAGARVGDRISCWVEVQQQARRGDWTFLVAGLEAASPEAPVLTGKATLLVPRAPTGDAGEEGRGS